MASAKRQHLAEDTMADNYAEAIQELDQLQDKLDQVGFHRLTRRPRSVLGVRQSA